MFGKKKVIGPCLLFIVTVFEQVTEMEHIQDTCMQDSRQSQKMAEKTPGVEFISINFIYVEVRHLNQSLSP